MLLFKLMNMEWASTNVSIFPHVPFSHWEFKKKKAFILIETEPISAIMTKP